MAGLQIRRCTEYLSGKWSDGLLPAQKGGGRGKIRGWHYSTNCGKQKQKAETETETESSEEEVEGRLGGGITVPIVGMAPKWG